MYGRERSWFKVIQKIFRVFQNPHVKETCVLIGAFRVLPLMAKQIGAFRVLPLVAKRYIGKSNQHCQDIGTNGDQ